MKRNTPSWFWRGGFFLLLFGLDGISKYIVSQTVPLLTLFQEGYPFGGIPIFCMGGVSFSLNQTFNTGIAWGWGEGYGVLWFGLRLILIAALFVYLFCYMWNQPWDALCLGFILAGALGNALDYVLYGHVIDFLHVSFWGHSFPIFNAADSWITLGAIGLFGASFLHPKKAM